MRSTFIILSFASFGLCLTARASASKTFPPVIATRLGLEKAPDCILCHRDENGGKNTIDKPFGRWVLKNGLAANQDGVLRTLIGQMDDLGVDSDGDCVPNTDELRNGTNPNVADVHVDGGGGCVADDASSPPSLNTGCAVRPASDGSARASASALGSLGLVMLLRTRRRRQTDPKPTP